LACCLHLAAPSPSEADGMDILRENTCHSQDHGIRHHLPSVRTVSGMPDELCTNLLRRTIHIGGPPFLCRANRPYLRFGRTRSNGVPSTHVQPLLSFIADSSAGVNVFGPVSCSRQLPSRAIASKLAGPCFWAGNADRSAWSPTTTSSRPLRDQCFRGQDGRFEFRCVRPAPTSAAPCLCGPVSV